MTETKYKAVGRVTTCGLRAWVALVLSAIALDAAATDYSGLAVMFVGIPAFLGFILLLAVLLMLRPSKARRATASTVAVLCALLVIPLSNDALKALRYPGGWVPVALLTGLIALSAFLFYRLMSKQAENCAARD